MKRFLCFFAFSVFSFLLIFSPLTAFATDYGNYCSDMVTYPTDDIPDFSGLVSNTNYVNFVIYNSYDSCYYILRTWPWNDPTRYSCQVKIVSNSGTPSLGATVLNCRFYVYKYDPNGSFTWTQTFYDYSNTGTYTWFVCPVDDTDKFKFLWCSSNFGFQAGQSSYVVTNDSSNSGSQYIYANFFDTSGLYLGDSNNDGNGGDDPSGGGGSYNDSSFKGLVTELFDHLFDVLLYGEDSGYDGTDVDDSIDWLEDLSDDMEDITIKLNHAPTYIQNGFTALSGAQTSINEFFTGISTAVPILYYGIVGILNIIIIRKIIGR